MRYYLSVDGGGTKTAFLLTDQAGNTAANTTLDGCSYAHIGQEGVENLLQAGVSTLVQSSGVQRGEIVSAAWGIPCYGENPAFDEQIARFIPTILPLTKHYVCNDVEVGFAGSLLLKPGIHLVAGTGAIGLGKNSRGETARANGWHEAFSDEGSAYWLGMQALALFAKQSDGRAEKGAFYHILKSEWRLEKDMDIIPYFISELQGRRDRIAGMQLLLCRAAEQGDASATALYQQAACALYETALGIYRQLGFSSEDHVKVSYFGGVYKAGALILTPLKKMLEELGAQLVPPALSPVSGGILLAARNDGHKHMNELVTSLKK